MITTPEILCDLFSFLDKDQIEKIQLVNQFWNNVVICHKNILPLRKFAYLDFSSDEIYLYATEEDFSKHLASYVMEFDKTNLSNKDCCFIKRPRYSQLTVDKVLKALNDVVFDTIRIEDCDSKDSLDNLLNLMKLVATKTGGRFRGRYGQCYKGRFGLELDEIFGKGFLNIATYKIHPN